jgi:hypothetical protein
MPLKWDYFLLKLPTAPKKVHFTVLERPLHFFVLNCEWTSLTDRQISCGNTIMVLDFMKNCIWICTQKRAFLFIFKFWFNVNWNYKLSNMDLTSIWATFRKYFQYHSKFSVLLKWGASKPPCNRIRKDKHFCTSHKFWFNTQDGTQWCK